MLCSLSRYQSISNSRSREWNKAISKATVFLCLWCIPTHAIICLCLCNCVRLSTCVCTCIPPPPLPITSPRLLMWLSQPAGWVSSWRKGWGAVQHSLKIAATTWLTWLERPEEFFVCGHWLIELHSVRQVMVRGKCSVGAYISVCVINERGMSDSPSNPWRDSGGMWTNHPEVRDVGQAGEPSGDTGAFMQSVTTTAICTMATKTNQSETTSLPELAFRCSDLAVLTTARAPPPDILQHYLCSGKRDTQVNQCPLDFNEAHTWLVQPI